MTWDDLIIHHAYDEAYLGRRVDATSLLPPQVAEWRIPKVHVYSVATIANK